MHTLHRNTCYVLNRDQKPSRIGAASSMNEAHAFLTKWAKNNAKKLDTMSDGELCYVTGTGRLYTLANDGKWFASASSGFKIAPLKAT